DIRCGDAGHAQGLLRRAHLGAPDLFGVVLDPARLRIVLGELTLRHLYHTAVMVEDDGTTAGRALIKGEKVFFHGAILKNRARTGESFCAVAQGAAFAGAGLAGASFAVAAAGAPVGEARVGAGAALAAGGAGLRSASIQPRTAGQKRSAGRAKVVTRSTRA